MTIARFRPILAGVAALSLAACGGNSLGALGDILGGVAGMPAGGGQRGQISAEIRQVDSQRQRLEVAAADGQTGFIRYDQNTVVVYRQEQYPVTSLERGDLAVVSVVQDAQGNMYAERIDVTQSLQERTGSVAGGGALRQFTGRVSQIDHTRGWFVVQDRTGNVTVTLPYNTPQATADYFHRLRVGDTVRLEAVVVGTNRVEIHRFL